MLGMTGSCALLLLISISSAILVVTHDGNAARVAAGPDRCGAGGVSADGDATQGGDHPAASPGLAGGLILLLAVVQPLLRVRWRS